MSLGISVPRFWRGKDFRYKLTGQRCESCGEFHFSRRFVCRRCGSRSFREDSLGTTARLLVFTVIRNPPAGSEDMSPYILGLVETRDGSKILAQITDCRSNELREGMELEATFRKIKEDTDEKLIAYGYKFRPIIS